MSKTAIETRRLSLAELEQWKAKAARLDRALEWLSGRADSEELVHVKRILEGHC